MEISICLSGNGLEANFILGLCRLSNILLSQTVTSTPPPPPTPYPHKKSPDLHDSEKSPLKVQGGGGPDPRTPPASYGPDGDVKG